MHLSEHLTPRAVWKMIQAGTLLYGLGTSLYLLARVTVGERWPWVALANNFVPWWALGGLLLAVIALFSRRRWWLIAPQVPILAAFVALYAPLLLPHDSVAQAGDGPHLTIATYNILSSQSDPERVRDVIRAMDADIVGLEEVGPAHSDVFERELSDTYPYQAMHPKLPVYGVALLSRYPILEETVIEPIEYESMMYLRAVLDVDGVRVTFYVAHPPPPYNAVSPIHYDSGQRNREIDILRYDYLERETGPLLVVGDFNMTDQSDPYRVMDGLLDDSFRETGWGMGFTFPDRNRTHLIPPLIRIDYVWHNAYFVAREARAWDDSGTSDHRPMLAELTLKTAP